MPAQHIGDRLLRLLRLFHQGPHPQEIVGRPGMESHIEGTAGVSGTADRGGQTVRGAPSGTPRSPGVTKQGRPDFPRRFGIGSGERTVLAEDRGQRAETRSSPSLDASVTGSTRGRDAATRSRSATSYTPPMRIAPTLRSASLSGCDR